MADNDLDAFFDEVSAVEAEVKQELVDDKDDADKAGSDGVHPEQEAGLQPPPAKKAKLNDRKPPKRPLGVVVAASSQVTSINVVPPPVAPVVPSVSSPASSLPSTSTAGPQPPLPPGPPPTQQKNQKPHKRAAAGKVWVDQSLEEWPENDYRIFVGNLSKDVSDQDLHQHFSKYPSLAMVKIVRDAQGTSKGYGFVSLMEPMECARAMREMDQTWLSSRPIRVKRSDWKDRDLKVVRRKAKKNAKNKRRMGF